MKQLLRHLLKLILAAIILFLVGFAILVGLILVKNNSARETEEQQLAFLDKHFNTIRNPIPAVVTDETLLPAYVGSFKRSDIVSSTNNCRNWGYEGSETCLSAFYGVNDRGFTVEVNVGEKTPQAMKDMQGFYICGGEVGGKFVLRTEANTPYLYLECFGFLTGEPFLYGVTWQNGDWTIETEGQYELLRQFIADYPY